MTETRFTGLGNYEKHAGIARIEGVRLILNAKTKAIRLAEQATVARKANGHIRKLMKERDSLLRFVETVRDTTLNEQIRTTADILLSPKRLETV